MENQMRRKFHGDPACQLRLKRNAMFLQFFHYALARGRSKHAEKDVCGFQIGRDFNVIDADERAFKSDFARDNSAQLSFYDFVDAQHAMFHKAVSFRSKLLGHRFELIALDDVADVVFTKIAELDTALQTGTDFFHVILETAKR